MWHLYYRESLKQLRETRRVWENVIPAAARVFTTHTHNRCGCYGTLPRLLHTTLVGSRKTGMGGGTSPPSHDFSTTAAYGPTQNLRHLFYSTAAG